MASAAQYEAMRGRAAVGEPCGRAAHGGGAGGMDLRRTSAARCGRYVAAMLALLACAFSAGASWGRRAAIAPQLSLKEGLAPIGSTLVGGLAPSSSARLEGAACASSPKQSDALHIAYAFEASGCVSLSHCNELPRLCTCPLSRAMSPCKPAIHAWPADPYPPHVRLSTTYARVRSRVATDLNRSFCWCDSQRGRRTVQAAEAITRAGGTSWCTFSTTATPACSRGSAGANRATWAQPGSSSYGLWRRGR